jgi:hypothetical protein
MKFLNRARKELKVGLSSAMSAVGIKKDEEYPEVRSREASLQDMMRDAGALFQQIQLFITQIEQVSAASTIIQTKLAGSIGPAAQIGSLTANLVGTQLGPGCLAVLTGFLDRAKLTETVGRKRRRNRQLAASTSGAEQQARLEKFQRYHMTFMTATESLTTLFATVITRVFQAHMSYSMQFGIAVNADIGRLAGELSGSRVAPSSDNPYVPPPGYEPPAGYVYPPVAPLGSAPADDPHGLPGANAQPLWSPA